MSYYPNTGSINPPVIGGPSTSLGGVPGLQIPAGLSSTNDSFGVSSASLMNQIFGSGLVTNVANFPSQEVATQSYVVTPWDNGYHTRMTRGQLVFCRRIKPRNDVMTIITLPQMNSTLHKAYAIAMDNGILERKRVDGDSFSDLQDAIKADLEDELDRKRRNFNSDHQEKAKLDNAVARLRNSNEDYHVTTEEYKQMIFQDRATQYLRYLSQGGILETWNYLGPVQNVEDAHRDFKNINVVQSGPIDIENIWGSKVNQGLYAGLVLTRVYDACTKESGQFQFVPWLEREDDYERRLYTKFPSAGDLAYTDIAGYTHYGKYIPVGKIGSFMNDNDRSDENAAVLAGVHGVTFTGDKELEAWRLASRMRKPVVYMTVGRDAWIKNF